MARLLAGLLLVFGGVTTALAAGIEVTAAYARATPPGAPVGGAYFEIRNRGDQADRLLAAASPVAGRVELHTHTVQDGVARMHEVPAIEAPAGQTVRLQPGGLHVMPMELKAPLKAGESFPLTLTFERAGQLEVTVQVKETTEVMSHGHHGHHGKH